MYHAHQLLAPLWNLRSINWLFDLDTYCSLLILYLITFFPYHFYFLFLKQKQLQMKNEKCYIPHFYIIFISLYKCGTANQLILHLITNGHYHISLMNKIDR
jgi:hypothetical protein